MKSVGSYEAKTHLPGLLKRVADGESIVITSRGKPVAMLVPVEQERDVESLVSEMLQYRDASGPRIGKGLTVRDLIEEGRRF
jgi:prevent-host-death family protein